LAFFPGTVATHVTNVQFRPPLFPSIFQFLGMRARRASSLVNSVSFVDEEEEAMFNNEDLFFATRD
jgi:hypothetical protein